MTRSATLILATGLTAIMTCGQATPSVRNIRFNGRTLTAEQQARLETLERSYGVRIPDNDYWYDNRSGAAGFWKGPAVAGLPPGLGLGGPMPANCSGGGTRVFVNGRELHPYDVAALSQLGPVIPGRYWLNANGNFGIEGGPMLGNLFLLARQVRSPGPHRVYAPGELSGIIVNSAGACTSAGNCAYPSH
jgi:hypothetical protein